MIFGVYAMAVICVLGIAAGQIMFKYSALAINEAPTLFSLKPLLFFGATMALYGITSVGWVLILRHAELGKIYPVMALAFAALIAAGLALIFSTSKGA
jgi:hypothetical protein